MKEEYAAQAPVVPLPTQISPSKEQKVQHIIHEENKYSNNSNQLKLNLSTQSVGNTTPRSMMTSASMEIATPRYRVLVNIFLNILFQFI